MHQGIPTRLEDNATTGAAMLCGTCLDPGKFVLTERPLPSAAEGEVLVDVAAVGICGTDYHIFAGRHPFLSYPRVIGHEVGGIVAEDSGRWSRGEPVVVIPYLACGTCRCCRRGRPNACERLEVLGVHRDGGLCRRIAVPSDNLVAVDGLGPVEAAMVEFLAIGAHAVRRARSGPNDRVLVVGAGPIGLATALFARMAGSEVHLLDRSAGRLAMAASRFGLTRIHDAARQGPAAWPAEGFDIVFDATGDAEAMEAGFDLVSHGGCYVLVGVVQDRIGFSDPDFHKREMALLSSRNALRADFDLVIASLRSGAVAATPFCSGVLDLPDFATRFADLAQDRANLLKIVVRP